jgi:uncharacterized protein
MTLRPFPTESRMRWRRLDVPGREEARVERTATGWRLTGELEIEEAGVAARLRYAIDCDSEWRTRSALIEGQAGGGPIRFALASDRAGHWACNGIPVWLRLPELRLEPLEQTSTRQAEESFRYRALVDGESLVARLDTDAFGRVLRDEGLWGAEPAASAEGRAGQGPTS